MPVICLVNGVEGIGLDPLDRGLQYGDGVFRTLRVVHGQPRWWVEHLASLAADAARLALDFPEASLWRADLAKLAARLDGGVLKLLLTRGGGARGYRPPEVVRPSRILIYDSVPPLSDAWPATGLNLRFCDLRLAAQPRLAGVKHLNRLENILARGEWNDPGIHEGLLRDEAGRVISGVMSNLFLWNGNGQPPRSHAFTAPRGGASPGLGRPSAGGLRTPRLDRCGVAGVTRARLMLRAVAAGIAVEECELGQEDVLAADEVMLCNGVIGLRRVARLGERAWPVPCISPELQSLLDA